MDNFHGCHMCIIPYMLHLDHYLKYFLESCSSKAFHVPDLELQFNDDCFLHLYCGYNCLLSWYFFHGKCSDVKVTLCGFESCVFKYGILLHEYSMYFPVKFVMSVNQLPP